MKLRRAATFAFLCGLLLPGCSSSHDGWFANPCPTKWTIRTFYVERGTNALEKSDEMIVEAGLEAAP